MASKLDPAKAAQAQQELEKGLKAIKTSAFKWKADHLAAEPCFKNAGRLFKAAGMYDSALDAYRKAAASALAMDNLKQAAVTLETAAREWSMLPGSGKQSAGELYAEAANLLQDAGELARASDLKVKAGKQLESINKDRANKLFEEAAAVFDGDTDKDVYAVQPLQLVLREQLALGKHASATRTLDKLLKIFTRLNQPHNVFKTLLARVILLLAGADPVTAQREYERCLDIPGFAASDEAAAAEDMIGCYTEMNSDALKSVVDRSVINYLDAPIARLAKGLPAALITGAQVGVSHAGESATAAIAPAKKREIGGLEGFREFGGGSVIGGGGAAAAAGDEETDGPGDASTAARARRDQDKAVVERSALFSKAGGGGSSSSSRAPSKAAPPPEEEEGYGDDGEAGGHPDEDDNDYRAEEEQQREMPAPSRATKAAPAPAYDDEYDAYGAAASAPPPVEEEEDLGLL